MRTPDPHRRHNCLGQEGMIVLIINIITLYIFLSKNGNYVDVHEGTVDKYWWRELSELMRDEGTMLVSL